MKTEMPVCLFGHTDTLGSLGTYVSLKTPIVTEGCTLRTYQVRPGTDIPADSPSTTLLSPKAKVDVAGCVSLG